MFPFPLPLAALLAPVGEFLVYLVIGFAFGFVLEISGFGNSKKLAAQFYFKDLTVLKVMFTAIIVAMVLIFAASGLGLLDYNSIWVNPTYLWPGIVGGLIMGVGFILGGFCPGTSLVAAATLKLDGFFFVIGGLFGIFLFGETVGFYDIFYNSSYLGRFTLPEWLGLPAGVVVLLVILMALFMFWGGEQLERIVGKKDLRKEPRLRYAGAGILVALAAGVILIGQPTTEDRWARIAAEKELLLSSRAVQIHPGELLAAMHDHKVNLVLLDVRSEADYNQFHLKDARRVDMAGMMEVSKELHQEPPNTVFVLMSNDETAATQAWKTLVAESVPNTYILEGGINQWLQTFAREDDCIRKTAFASLEPPANLKELFNSRSLEEPCVTKLEHSGDDLLEYKFGGAIGATLQAAYPDPSEFELEYTPKIELKNKKKASGGGCG